MADNDVQLLSQQLNHMIDLLRAENRLLGQRVALLERQVQDHENRLRTATEGITQVRTWAGLASAGSGVLSLAAMLRAFLGG